MLRVLIVSPYRGDTKTNLAYARAALLDSIERGEAPFASHLLYPQVLDDNDQVQRDLGLACEAAYMKVCHKVAVYIDLELSEGMESTVCRAVSEGVHVQRRSLFGWSKS
jgi:hypothetical protein